MERTLGVAERLDEGFVPNWEGLHLEGTMMPSEVGNNLRG